MSIGEDTFEFHCKALGIAVEREFRFDPSRKWRADFRANEFLIEIEGGTWNGGRHNRGAGFEKDCEKYNQAAVLGFKVLRFTTGMVKSGEAIKVLQLALGLPINQE
jgi:very-short-patch-repair endonuclease